MIDISIHKFVRRNWNIKAISSREEINVGDYIQIWRQPDSRFQSPKNEYSKVVYIRDKDFILTSLDNDNVYIFKYEHLPKLVDAANDCWIYLTPISADEMMVEKL